MPDLLQGDILKKNTGMSEYLNPFNQKGFKHADTQYES